MILTNECYFEVQGYELDSFNHVNNAVYLNYLEAARWKFFKEINMLDHMKMKKLYPVVIEVNIKYLKELRLFDNFKVKSKYSLENNYIVANQKIKLNGRNESIIKAIVKMLLVSESRIIHDIPLEMINIFNGADQIQA